MLDFLRLLGTLSFYTMNNFHPAEFSQRWMKPRQMAAALIRGLVRSEHHASAVLQNATVNTATHAKPHGRSRASIHWLIVIAKRRATPYLKAFLCDRRAFGQPAVARFVAVDSVLPTIHTCTSDAFTKLKGLVGQRFNLNTG